MIEEAEKGNGQKKDQCHKFHFAQSLCHIFKNHGEDKGSHQTGLFSGKRKKVIITQQIHRQSILLVDESGENWKYSLASNLRKVKQTCSTNEDQFCCKQWILSSLQDKEWTLSQVSLSGKAATITSKNILPSISAHYYASKVYNVDESNLFYQCLSSNTFTVPAEEALAVWRNQTYANWGQHVWRKQTRSSNHRKGY